MQLRVPLVNQLETHLANQLHFLQGGHPIRQRDSPALLQVLCHQASRRDNLPVSRQDNPQRNPLDSLLVSHLCSRLVNLRVSQRDSPALLQVLYRQASRRDNLPVSRQDSPQRNPLDSLLASHLCSRLVNLRVCQRGSPALLPV